MNGFEDLMIAEGAVVSGNVRCGKDYWIDTFII